MHEICTEMLTLQWHRNEHDGISNHRHLDCLLNCLFRCRSKKTSKLRITGLGEGNSPVTIEFTAQRASNVENVSTWWRHPEVMKVTALVITGDIEAYLQCHQDNQPDEVSVSVKRLNTLRPREREIKFIGLFGDRGHRGQYGPYKPCNHNLYIGVIIT